MSEEYEVHGGIRMDETVVGKSSESRSLVRIRPRWEDNIKLDFKASQCENAGWTKSAQDVSVVVFCEHCSEHSVS
jgi:hypothetical protein